MEAEITLQLNENTLHAAEELAKRKGISLNQLAETLFGRAAASQFRNIEELPIADWVLLLGEGEREYRPTTRKQLKEEYFQDKN